MTDAEMTRKDDHTPSGSQLAAALIADLGGAPLPEEGVRDTHGHNAAAFAVEAHKPPRAHEMGTQPNPVVVSQTDPQWPPPSSNRPGVVAPTMLSAGQDARDRERDEVTVPRALPVPLASPLPSPSPLPPIARSRVGRTTIPSVRVKSKVGTAIVGGFAVGGLLVGAIGLWIALSRTDAPPAVRAASTPVVEAPPKPLAPAVSPPAAPVPVVVASPVAVSAPQVSPPAAPARPWKPSPPVRPAADAENSSPRPPPTVTTKPPAPASTIPIEPPERTF